MKKIEVVLTDLDGVVFDGRPPASSAKTLETLNLLREKNIPVIPVTGRDFYRSLQYIGPLAFQHYGIFNGGARIADIPSQKIFSETGIDHATTLTIVEHFMDYAEFIGYGKARTAVKDIDLRDVKTGAPSLWAEVREEDCSRAAQFLQNGLGVQFHENRGTTGPLVGLDITHETIDKQVSALSVLELMGIAPENAMAIGDGKNDIPMFKCAGLSVAMGNAPLEVQRVADVTVGTIQNEGFSEAMHRYVLL